MHRSIEEAGLDISEFDAVIGRGGLLRPTPGGVYEVDEYIIHDLIHAEMEHVCNLGALLADILAKEAGCRSFIADPELSTSSCLRHACRGCPCSNAAAFFMHSTARPLPVFMRARSAAATTN